MNYMHSAPMKADLAHYLLDADYLVGELIKRKILHSGGHLLLPMETRLGIAISMQNKRKYFVNTHIQAMDSVFVVSKINLNTINYENNI